MKASKQFATSHGHSHFPSNMKHVEYEVFTVPNIENNETMIILSLFHQGETAATEMRIRMSPVEASALGTKLARMANNK